MALDVREIFSQKELIQEQLDELLHPLETAIKAALKGYGQWGVGIESYTLETKTVFVTYGWSCRGSYDSARVDIPIAILESNDPEQAAKQAKEAHDNAVKQSILLSKEFEEKREFQRLKQKFEGK